MKVALINAPYIDLYGPIKSAAGRYFPLGLGYIASVLKRGGNEVIIIDPEAEGIDYSEIRRRLRNFSPRIVGISSATPNFGKACKIAKIAKEEGISMVVLGGTHASSMPEVIIKNYPAVDIVCIGEGEEMMLELCQGRDLQQIKGICYRKDGGIFRTPPRDFIEDVDSIPFPARELVNLNWYRPNTYIDRGKRSATLITSRGCPNRCVFCASHTTLGKKFRAHSPEYVLGEIEHLNKQYGIEHFVFNDDTFTMNRQRVREICSRILERNLRIEWYCFARVNTVDRDLLSLMKRAGCTQIGFGIESGDEQILKNLKKNITLEQSIQALRICNELGIETFAFFIFGCPGESATTIKKTIEFSKKIKPTLAFFNMLVPYPGTEIFNSSYTDLSMLENWDDFVAIGVNPVVDSPDLPKEALQKWVYRANLAFYLRPSQLWTILRHIKSLKEMWIKLAGGYGLLRQILKWRSGRK